MRTFNFTWSDDRLTLDAYKIQIVLYHGETSHVKAIYTDNNQEFLPLDDALHGLFVRYENEIYSLYQVLLNAELQLSLMGE